MIDVLEYQPQLIVGYDAQNETADLIHVSKAIIGKDYYCPCCGGVIRARALDSQYKQPHYYHLNASCSKESQIHWMYTHYLLTNGSQFYVGSELFTVQFIEIEAAWNTSLGLYRPNITVYTTDGKKVFFEIFFTSKKDEEYLYKWQELDCDVVEVDVKKLLNAPVQGIPTFEYLYHDGKMFKKEYHVGNLYASTIGARKENIRRSDYQHYKEHWAKLDWFYQLLKDAIKNNVTEEELLLCFRSLDLDDMYACYGIIRHTNCVKHYKESFKEIINNGVIEQLESLLKQDILMDEDDSLEHISPYKWELNSYKEIHNDYINIWYNNRFTFRFTSSLYNIEQVDENISEYKEKCKEWLHITNIFKNFEKTKEIEDKYNVHIHVSKDYIAFLCYDQEIDRYTNIANIHYNLSSLNNIGDVISLIEEYYVKYEIKKKIKHINAMHIIKEWSRNKVYENNIEKRWNDYIKEKDYISLMNIGITPHAFVKEAKDEKYDAYFAIYMGNEKLYETNISENQLDKMDYDHIYQVGIDGIEKIHQEAKDLKYYIDRINECKNKCWKAELSRSNDIYKNRFWICIKVYNTEKLCERISYRKVNYETNMFDKLYDAMQEIIKDKEFFGIGICTEEEVKQHEFSRTQ